MIMRMVVALVIVVGMVGSSVDAQPPGGGRGGAGRAGAGQGGAERGGRGGAQGQRLGRGGFQVPGFPLLEALDANKDGKLSSAEIANAVAALKKLDKDKDGELSQEEIGWPPMGRGMGGRGGMGGAPGGPGGGFGGAGGVNMVERIMSNDKDKDGKVTREELPEFMQRMLDRGDTNKDGAIDKAEAEAMSAAFGRGGRGGRGGAQGGGQGGRGDGV